VADDPVMDAAAPLVVELRLEPQPGGDGAVHVAGTVCADGHPARPFSGWMALLQTLEALVTAQQ
jgi:hypothetical protein